MRPYSPLAPRARVALVAPSGPLKLPIDLDRAIENAEKLGWEPIVGAHAKSRHTYFAGTDEERLTDLNQALQDDSIDGVWCLRGGYGAMRLLQHVDYDALRRRPKPVIGYSDISALHCAIGAQAGLATIHAPTARGRLSAFSERSLRAAATRTVDPCGIASEARTLVSGRARGRLVGGNLALLCALHGTPFQPNYDGAILVLEDVNEAPYRIERMLLQLRLSGDLQGCAAIAFGNFTNTGEKDDSLGGTRSLAEVLEEAAKTLGVPTISGIPLGHVSDQWSVPLGMTAELDADAKRLTVIY
jgi:muramoyltetrapeptide carboxypeptidase